MTYTEFKDYIATFLWKSTDSDLVANLDNLIKMANTSLTRDLRAADRATSALLTISTEDMPLPDDYHSMRSVGHISGNSFDNQGQVNYVGPAELDFQRGRTQSRQFMPIYSLTNRTIRFVSPTADPDSYAIASLYYRAKVPDFKTTDSSWLAEDFLDLYVYATLLHCAGFLREDERIQLWTQMHASALNSANEDFTHEQEIGVYSAMPLPTTAGISRKGDRTTYKSRSAT